MPYHLMHSDAPRFGAIVSRRFVLVSSKYAFASPSQGVGLQRRQARSKTPVRKSRLHGACWTACAIFGLSSMAITVALAQHWGSAAAIAMPQLARQIENDSITYCK